MNPLVTSAPLMLYGYWLPDGGPSDCIACTSGRFWSGSCDKISQSATCEVHTSRLCSQCYPADHDVSLCNKRCSHRTMCGSRYSKQIVSHPGRQGFRGTLRNPLRGARWDESRIENEEGRMTKEWSGWVDWESKIYVMTCWKNTWWTTTWVPIESGVKRWYHAIPTQSFYNFF